ncbi:MAG: hypothetical protein ABI690_26085 [Chloroflexota bacterium]
MAGRPGRRDTTLNTQTSQNGLGRHNLLKALHENPVTLAELSYQNRSKPRQRRWIEWLIRGDLILSLVLSLILAGGEFIGGLLYRDPSPIFGTLGILTQIPVASAFILHFALMIQTLSLSATASHGRDKLVTGTY